MNTLSYILFKLINFLIYSSFRIIEKLSGKYRVPLRPPPAHHTHMHSLPHYQHALPECGTFVNIDDPSLSPKSIVYMFTFVFSVGVVHSMSFDKCRTTCIHHNSIMRNNFNALKMFCVPPLYSSLPANPRT